MIDLIFFAAMAVFVGVKLYNVLGNKDFEPNEVAVDPNVAKVVDTSYVEITKTDDEQLDEKYGKTLADKVRAIMKHDSSFNLDAFVVGASKAFEMIVKAFSKGDKKSLKPLLHKDVYESFSAVIDERQGAEKLHETTLLAIVSSTVKDIFLSKKYARIAVQIISEQVNIVRDKQGKIIEGDPSAIDKVSEVWTFGRDLNSQNPNWELLETAPA